MAQSLEKRAFCDKQMQEKVQDAIAKDAQVIESKMSQELISQQEKNQQSVSRGLRI